MSLCSAWLLVTAKSAIFRVALRIPSMRSSYRSAAGFVIEWIACAILPSSYHSKARSKNLMMCAYNTETACFTPLVGYRKTASSTRGSASAMSQRPVTMDLPSFSCSTTACQVNIRSWLVGLDNQTIHTPNTNFIAPQASATYSGWCCTSTSITFP